MSVMQLKPSLDDLRKQVHSNPRKAAARRHMPTMEKDTKLKTMQRELPSKMKRQAESIAARQQFLQTTDASNYRHEVSRLQGDLDPGRGPQIRYEKGIKDRISILKGKLEAMRPIVGKQGAYAFF